MYVSGRGLRRVRTFVGRPNACGAGLAGGHDAVVSGAGSGGELLRPCASSCAVTQPLGYRTGIGCWRGDVTVSDVQDSHAT